MSEKSKSTFAYSLENTIGFDEQDLAANALGTLSERQQVKIRKRRLQLAVFSAVLALCFGLLGASQIAQALSGGVGARISLESCLFAGVVLAIFFMFVAIRLHSYTSTLGSPVNTVEGLVRLNIAEQMKTARYSISIDDVHFYVQKPVFLAFKNGDPYRICYAPGSNTILSAEWLRGD